MLAFAIELGGARWRAAPPCLCRSLQQLDLSNARVDDPAAVVLLDSLWTNRSLCVLNVTGNPFGKATARLLAVLITCLPAESVPEVLIAGCALERSPALLVVRALSNSTDLAHALPPGCDTDLGIAI